MSKEPSAKSWLLLGSTAGALACLLPLLILWQGLPEPVAVHWGGATGAPDGSLSKAGLVLFSLGGLGLALVSSWPRSAPQGPATWRALALITFTSSLLTLVNALVIHLNWEQSTWRAAARFSLPLLLVLIVVPATLAVVVYFHARRAWPPTPTTKAPPPAMELGEGEAVYWSGSATNPWLLALALFALAVGALLSVVIEDPTDKRIFAACHFFALVLTLFVYRVRVTLDSRAVVIRYGIFGWPRQRIPLARIVSANVCDVEPMAHGGWGYRGSLRLAGRAAVIIRSGMALELALKDAKKLSITVDDADTAAQLLNGLMARAR